MLLLIILISCNITYTNPQDQICFTLGFSMDKLARPLTHIFNNSVDTGIIPEDWKSANVTAIRKKGTRQEPGNYRLISLTSVVRKIIG